MGVEYGINTGIGVEVSHVEGVEDKETYIEDNMWEDLNKNGYFSERYGNCYGSKELSLIILIKDPFENDNYDMTKKIEKLKNFCKERSIIIKKIGLVGGLYVY